MAVIGSVTPSATSCRLALPDRSQRGFSLSTQSQANGGHSVKRFRHTALLAFKYLCSNHSRMRKGVLSDEYIRNHNPAFFVADDDTHQRTLSQHHEHVRSTAKFTRGRHRPQRARRPRIPFYTLYDTARYVDQGNPYETAHDMVVHYTARTAAPGPSTPRTPSSVSRTVLSSSGSSSSSAHVPRTNAPFLVTRYAAAFDHTHPELQEAALSPETKAFLQLSDVEPLRVLTYRSLGRFGTTHYYQNSLTAVQERALDLTQNSEADRNRVLDAMQQLARSDRRAWANGWERVMRRCQRSTAISDILGLRVFFKPFKRT